MHPDQGPCWLDHRCAGHKYSQISVHNHRYLTHRLSWFYEHGTDPVDYQINHHCDNHRCINPDHLYAGDGCDNMRDRKQRGRYGIGLTPPQAEQMRRRYAHGTTYAELMVQFSCASMTVSNVLAYRGPYYLPKAQRKLKVVGCKRYHPTQLTVAERLRASIIRERYATGRYTQQWLADRYGLGPNTIRLILHRRGRYRASLYPTIRSWITASLATH